MSMWPLCKTFVVNCTCTYIPFTLNVRCHSRDVASVTDITHRSGVFFSLLPCIISWYLLKDGCLTKWSTYVSLVRFRSYELSSPWRLSLHQWRHLIYRFRCLCCLTLYVQNKNSHWRSTSANLVRTWYIRRHLWRSHNHYAFTRKIYWIIVKQIHYKFYRKKLMLWIMLTTA